MEPYTLERQMARMGYPASEQGPYVTELRKHIQKQLDEGMVMRSAGSWAPEAASLSYEERAKATLAFDWAIGRRHGYRVEVFDPLWGWKTNVQTMKRTYYIRWRKIPAWIGDRFRELGGKYRVWRDRNLQNPYA